MNTFVYILDGFSKKISDVDHTSNHGTSCEYAHPYFMKEHPYLLLSIKQKRGEKVVSIKWLLRSYVMYRATAYVATVHCVVANISYKFMAHISLLRM